MEHREQGLHNGIDRPCPGVLTLAHRCLARSTCRRDHRPSEISAEAVIARLGTWARGMEPAVAKIATTRRRYCEESYVG
jgi:hypothetical protein